MTSFDLLLRRSDLADAVLRDAPEPVAGAGEAVLRVDRVGMTANNVTYAVFGEAMGYWQFFPTEDPERARVPLWGYADVVHSQVDGLAEGARVYGYLPSSGHLRVQPAPTEGGFRDASAHRAALPAVYNSYAVTRGVERDPDEDLQVLFRPLFLTSLMLQDVLAELPAEQVVLSSASSKTAYGTAQLLAAQPARPRVVGLTSPGNAAFTASLGCYDQVLTYDEVESLSRVPTAYADVAGSTAVRAEVHRHLGTALGDSLVVGAARHTEGGTGALGGGERLPGPRPTLFFAPDRIAQRTDEWGAAGFAERADAAWTSFVAAARGWVDVVHRDGPEGLRDSWLAVLAGGLDPRTGLVVVL